MKKNHELGIKSDGGKSRVISKLDTGLPKQIFSEEKGGLKVWWMERGEGDFCEGG